MTIIMPWWLSRFLRLQTPGHVTCRMVNGRCRTNHRITI